MPITTSQYISHFCKFEDCLCKRQEALLNHSLKALAEDSTKCDPMVVDKEFSPQIISRIKAIYKCVPCLRSSCKMIATTDFLYVLGGSNSNIEENNDKALRDIWRFNIITRHWTQLKVENVPETLIVYSMCFGTNIESDRLVGYIFGGALFYTGTEMSNKMFKFIIDNNDEINFEKVKGPVQRKNRFSGNKPIIKSIFPLHWSFNIKSDGKEPEPRCGSAMVMNNNGELYLIGGVNEKGKFLLDAWKVDMKNEVFKWEALREHGKDQLKASIDDQTQTLESIPEFPGRYMHEALLMEDEKILLIGGGDGEWSAPLDKIDAYDIKSNTFVKIETIPDKNHGFPIPRQFQTCVRDDEKIYVLGGWAVDKSIPNSSSNKDENAVIFDDIWQLKRIQIGNHFYYKWTQTVSNLKMPIFFRNLKMPIFFHSSAITPDGCIYTFGGCKKPIFPSNKLQRVWIRPPTLKLMAMFRVLANYPPIINEIPMLEEKARVKKIEKELVVSNPIRLLKAWRQKC